jgi:hypothetical protein
VLAGGGQPYATSFLQHWVHRVMFYRASEEVFLAVYVAFFAALVLSLWFVKPRWPAGGR